ncbi:DUF2806 domain-containing protein [Planktotalea sp.]|uniref:DUF2806 domain-containing protein n=1 Tax=Planktotalea sp. TaxID=2029877 RepID=UPI003D6B0BCA
MDYPGEKVLIRLLDLLQTGAGGIFGPWQEQRIGLARTKARIAERLLLEQAEIDVAELRSGRKKIDRTSGLLIENSPAPLLLTGPIEEDTYNQTLSNELTSEFAVSATSTARANEIQQAINLKRISLFAEEAAEEMDADVSQTSADGAVDPDWFSKWRISAQNVSREEMQRLWAKLLAGEVNQPGKFSMRAMEYLSNMSVDEADLLAKIGPFVTNGGIIKLDNKFLENKGITFSDLLTLEELALISSASSLGGISYKFGSTEHKGEHLAHILCHDSVLEVKMKQIKDETPELTFAVINVTRTAIEILSLADFEIDEQYLTEVAEKAVKKGADKVQLGRLHTNRKNYDLIRTLATSDA